MTYKEKLLDPRWQKKRLKILERDQFTCQFCFSNKKQLQVHHKYYKNCDPWEYQDDALITLCCECHLLETETNDYKTVDLDGNKISFYYQDNEIMIISDSPIIRLSLDAWRRINFKTESRLKNK